MQYALVLVLFFCCACEASEVSLGETPAVDTLGVQTPAAESGSRLIPRKRIAADGSWGIIPGLWWDQLRGEECSFRLAEDGVERCLPTADFGSTKTATTATAVYPLSDPGCTNPLVFHPIAVNCPSADEYGSGPDPVSCVGKSVHKIIAEYTDTQGYVKFPGQPCNGPAGILILIPENTVTYRADHVPPTYFVGELPNIWVDL